MKWNNSYRVAHQIKRNHGNAIPRLCVFVDTETRGSPHPTDKNATYQDLFFGWACFSARYNGNSWGEPQWFRFETPQQFWDWLVSLSYKRTKLMVYAHNWSFDAQVLGAVDELHNRGWTMVNPIIDSKLFSIKWRLENRTIHLVDTMNYFSMSLAALGDSVGSKKLPMPQASSPIEEWDEYCKQDVEVIRKAMIGWFNFIREEDLGTTSITLSGQSWNAYRHKFMKHPIYVGTNRTELLYSRVSYAGGVNLMFKFGPVREHVYCLDINSMYPYIMSRHLFPSKMITTYRNRSFEDFKDDVFSHLLVADVQLHTDKPYYGIHYNSRLVFPIGSFRAILSTGELRDAMSRGHISNYYQAVVYAGHPLFKGYVEHFYNLRLNAKAEGNEVMATNAKLLLNSLYGKTGQRGIQWEDAGPSDEPDASYRELYDLDTMTIRKERTFGGRTQLLSRRVESRESIPSIASHVTGYARSYLWWLIDTAGRQNVYYCDTDSVFVNDDGFRNLKHLIHPTQLGALKVEWETDNLILRGLKDYSYNDTDKIKGIRKDAIKTGPASWTQDMFRGFKGAIRDGETNRQMISRVVKTLSGEYSKGTIEGSDVKPYIFDTTTRPERLDLFDRLWEEEDAIT